MPSKREQIRARQRSEKRRSTLVAVGIGAVLVGAVAYFVVRAMDSPAVIPADVDLASTAVEVMTDTAHVEVGTDPGPFNTDPPSSGRHYAAQAFAGFYETDPFPVHPEGYLVHSLEHGYVIFWYNCDLLSDSACDDLKSQIQDALDQADGLKVIGFPWPSLEVPVVLTSWGRRLEMETFDPAVAAAFVQQFRNQAPEPNGP